jgi:hypothetical protein
MTPTTETLQELAGLARLYGSTPQTLHGAIWLEYLAAHPGPKPICLECEALGRWLIDGKPFVTTERCEPFLMALRYGTASLKGRSSNTIRNARKQLVGGLDRAGHYRLAREVVLCRVSYSDVAYHRAADSPAIVG